MQWNYRVSFTKAINGALAGTLEGLPDALIVCDERVASLHATALESFLGSHRTLLVTADEQTKSLAGVAALVDWLIQQRAVKSSTIVAIGGGCIQDLVSFTSHLYYRGIDWHFLPTTVLSQADSCIGAKSGINVLPFKNQLGALHSPRSISIASDFLETLPDLEVASGYGEIVKLAVTSSRHFLPLLEDSLADGGLRNPHLSRLTHASLQAKQEIIEEDEAEADLRRILNYGHSFGHALEALTGHQVPHGLGVLWGIDVINWLGERWGITDPNTAIQLSRVIRTHFNYQLPTTPTASELVSQLGRDKKVSGGLMHFAVLESEGTFAIVPTPLDESLTFQVAEYLETDYVFRRP